MPITQIPLPPPGLFNVELFTLWCILIHHNVNRKTWDCMALANAIPCNMMCQTHPQTCQFQFYLSCIYHSAQIALRWQALLLHLINLNWLCLTCSTRMLHKGCRNQVSGSVMFSYYHACSHVLSFTVSYNFKLILEGGDLIFFS